MLDAVIASIERTNFMATRTAPAVTGAVTSVNSTLHFVDASGDNYTDNLVTVTAPTPAEIEAWAVAYQAATQASLWKVSSLSIWEGDEDPDNADVGQRNSVKDGVNMLWKNIATLNTQNPRLVAPIAAVMQGNQDIPLLTATEFTNLIVAMQAILTGYNLQSAQYSERRERKNNPRIKA